MPGDAGGLLLNACVRVSSARARRSSPGCATPLPASPARHLALASLFLSTRRTRTLDQSDWPDDPAIVSRLGAATDAGMIWAGIRNFRRKKSVVDPLFGRVHLIKIRPVAYIFVVATLVLWS